MRLHYTFSLVMVRLAKAEDVAIFAKGESRLLESLDHI
jgi:hypothetical protein